MDRLRRQITNLAVSIFAVIIGLDMWFTAQGYTSLVALMIIIIGISALESNITSILKLKRGNSKEARQADR